MHRVSRVHALLHGALAASSRRIPPAAAAIDRSGCWQRGKSLSGGWGVLETARRASETLEKWIKSQAVAGSKKIFLFNLKGKLGKVDQARGMSDVFVQRVRDGAERLEQNETARQSDERSLYHIQTASVVLAAFRVLTEQLRMDRLEAIDCIRQCLGDSDSVGEKTIENLTKLTSRVMVSVLPGDEASFLVKTAYNMSELDFGKSFCVTHADSPLQHVASVHRCFYHDFFSTHLAPELTSEIFCRADEALFEKATGFDMKSLKERGVFRVDGTLASGQSSCRFVINKGSSEKGVEGPGSGRSGRREMGRKEEITQQRNHGSGKWSTCMSCDTCMR